MRTLLDEKQAETSKLRAHWEARISELESEIGSLPSEFLHQQEDAKAAITQWTKRASDLEERNAILENEAKSANDELARAMDALNSTKDEIRAQLDSELRRQVDDIEAQSKEVINEWQERVSELEAAVADLEQQLEAQKAEATNPILDWQETYSALEKEYMESKEEHDSLAQNLIAALKFEVENKDDMLLTFVEGYAMRELELIMTRAHLLK